MTTDDAITKIAQIIQEVRDGEYEEGADALWDIGQIIDQFTTEQEPTPAQKGEP